MVDYLMEQVAYLRGLIDGFGIGDSTNEGKILVNVVDILDDIAEEIKEIHISKSELDDYVQLVDEDLSRVEDIIYDNEGIEGDYGEYLDDSEYIEVECPHCEDIVCLPYDMFNDREELSCPNCNKLIYHGDDDSDDKE